MGMTLPDIEIGDNWISLNAASGIAVGTAMVIQNKSVTWAFLAESSNSPANSSTDGILLTDLYHQEPTKIVTAGSLEIWAKSSLAGRKCVVSIQQL